MSRQSLKFRVGAIHEAICVSPVLSRSIWRKPPERVGGASALADTAVGEAVPTAGFANANVGKPDGLAAFLFGGNPRIKKPTRHCPYPKFHTYIQQRHVNAVGAVLSRG
jgi:hypothetical protein